MTKLCIGVGLSILTLCVVDSTHWQLWAGIGNSWLTLGVIIHAILSKGD